METSCAFALKFFYLIGDQMISLYMEMFYHCQGHFTIQCTRRANSPQVARYFRTRLSSLFNLRAAERTMPILCKFHDSSSYLAAHAIQRTSIMSKRNNTIAMQCMPNEGSDIDRHTSCCLRSKQERTQAASAIRQYLDDMYCKNSRTQLEGSAAACWSISACVACAHQHHSWLYVEAALPPCFDKV